MKSIVYSVSEAGMAEAVRDLCRAWLEKGCLDALLVPREVSSGAAVVQSMVTDPAALAGVDPFAPVMPVSTARIVSDLTKVTPSNKRIGVVARPCEIRALVELVKLKQASLENIVLIGMDCQGTLSVQDYAALSETQVLPGDSATMRQACRVCDTPVPHGVDLILGTFGAKPGEELILMAQSPAGEELLAASGHEETSVPTAREEAVNEEKARRAKAKEAFLAELDRDLKGHAMLGAALAACTGCHNCREACPVCYCRECIFDSPTFDLEANDYLGRADRMHGLRMPTDTLLFHLTRLNHMVTSCVGCGLCGDACPNGIRVFEIFRRAAERTQAAFEYRAGRSLDDELPLTTFKEDEFQDATSK